MQLNHLTPYFKTLFLGVVVLFSSCVVPKNPVINKYSQHEIATEYGPEDIVLDTLSSLNPRLIISCDNRRQKSQSGFIQAMNLDDEKVYSLNRMNEPEKLVFHPHGIDVVQLEDGTIKLYVVNHNEEEKEQSILVYRILNNDLIFERKITDSKLVSPNDVAGTSSGLIITGNEFHKRNAKLSALLGLKTGCFIEISENKSVKRESNFCYANGLAIYKNQLLTVGSRNRFLYAAPLNYVKSSKKTKVVKIKGADNIAVIGSKAYIACHVNLLKFVKHAKSTKNNSPTVVYEIDLLNYTKSLLYTNTDGKINGASTAIYYKGRLYLSQVFEPFILVVESK